MRARVLTVTVVAVLSLCVSPVFGQCCGSVATTYVPAVPAYTTYYPSRYVTYYGPTVTVYPTYYVRPGWSIFGAPRVYVAGQPVRNVLRAITP
jgi:hypothetical protein